MLVTFGGKWSAKDRKLSLEATRNGKGKLRKPSTLVLEADETGKVLSSTLPNPNGKIAFVLSPNLPKEVRQKFAAEWITTEKQLKAEQKKKSPVKKKG